MSRLGFGSSRGLNKINSKGIKVCHNRRERKKKPPPRGRAVKIEENKELMA
jgi:hypothetical protein